MDDQMMAGMTKMREMMAEILQMMDAHMAAMGGEKKEPMQAQGQAAWDRVKSDRKMGGM